MQSVTVTLESRKILVVGPFPDREASDAFQFRHRDNAAIRAMYSTPMASPEEFEAQLA